MNKSKTIRVLEYISKSSVKPVGGPSGYVFNLTSNYSSDIITIDYLPEASDGLRRNVKMPTALKNMLKVANDIKKIKKLYNGCEADIDLNNYDFIHFHSTHDYFSARKMLKDYKGKTLLTSHSPKPLYQEFIDDWYSDFERLVLRKYATKKYEYIDEYAFNNVDYILFPCEYAEEPYYNKWGKYTIIKNKNKNKYIYMETGAIQKSPRLSKDDIRSKLNLKNEFVACYVGRHSAVKGYDSFKTMGNKLINTYDNLTMLICGKEEPLKGLNSNKWIEIGWTFDADSYIATSNVFILPNKETYFDLILLEVLSLGKIVIASYTGGNKYFERFTDSGIFLYRNDDEFFNIFEKVMSFSNEELCRLERKNLDIYNSYFDEKVFFKRYEKILMDLSDIND